MFYYHRFQQPPPPLHATPMFMQSPSTRSPPLDGTPAPLFMPCHHPPHHALQSTQAALPYDDMGATATDALDGVLIKSILMNFILC